MTRQQDEHTLTESRENIHFRSAKQSRIGGQSGLKKMRQSHCITALANAIREGDIRAIKRIINDIGDIDVRDSNCFTPLMASVLQGADKDVISVLANAGADVNAQGPNNSSTPLTLAAASSDEPEVIRILLQAGADIRALLADGTTALSIAA